MHRVLITRSPHQSSDLAERLRALNAEPILIPTIETVDPTTFAPLDAALANLTQFDWLIFTSANAVESFHRRLLIAAPLARSTEPFPRTAAIGPATAGALEAIGIIPALVPPQAIAESLAEALLPHALRPDATPARFLLVRAESAGPTPPREHLPETLRAAGAEVTIVPAYRTVLPTGSIAPIRDLFASPKSVPDAITFTSSSTARNLFTLLEAAGVILPEAPLRKPILASIGPITSATLRELGHPPHVESPEATVAGLAENLVKYLDLWKSS